MNISSKTVQNTLYLFLEGEIDESSAKTARNTADKIIDENIYADQVVFELSQITFMDSTGIGFLIGRYKRLNRNGINAFILSPNPTADKILSMSGIYNLIPKLN